MATVLLVSIYYAPEKTGIGINNSAMAGALRESGHSVTVVTGMPHYPEWQVHEPYRGRWRCREVVDGVHLRRYAHHVPRHHTAASRAAYELSFAANALTSSLPTGIDAVVAVVPTLASAAIAGVAAARSRAPWGIVFSDLSGRAALQSGLPGGRGVAGLVSELELWLARRADAVAVITPGFQPYLLAGGVRQGRLFSILNTNRVARPSIYVDRHAVRTSLAWPSDTCVVLHTGNMGFKQGLETVLDSARVARETGRDYLFVLMGSGNQRSRLEAAASRMGLSNVRFVDAVTAADYPGVLQAADFLLLNQRASVRDMSLPGKLSNYLASGTPTLAAVADNSETAAEIRRSGGAYLVPPEEPQRLIDAMDQLRSTPALRRELTARAQSFEAARQHAAISTDINAFVKALIDLRAST